MRSKDLGGAPINEIDRDDVFHFAFINLMRTEGDVNEYKK